MSLLEKIIETRDFLVEKGLTEPEFGLILGSGLGELAEEVENAIVIDYADLTMVFFPASDFKKNVRELGYLDLADPD